VYSEPVIVVNGNGDITLTINDEFYRAGEHRRWNHPEQRDQGGLQDGHPAE